MDEKCSVMDIKMLLITQFFLSRTLRKLAEQALTAVKTLAVEQRARKNVLNALLSPLLIFRKRIV